MSQQPQQNIVEEIENDTLPPMEIFEHLMEEEPQKKEKKPKKDRKILVEEKVKKAIQKIRGDKQLLQALLCEHYDAKVKMNALKKKIFELEQANELLKLEIQHQLIIDTNMSESN